MKTRSSFYFCFLLFLLMVSPASAQKQWIGLQGGLLSSHLAMDFEPEKAIRRTEAHYQRINNLYFSLNYSRQLIGKFYLGSGMELYNKGAIMDLDSSYSNPQNANWYENSIHSLELLSYLSVPLVLSRQIDLGAHSLNLHAGIGINYLVRARAEGDIWVRRRNIIFGTDTTYRETFNRNAEGYRKWDLSVFFGAGYRYRFMKNMALGIEYRCIFNNQNINTSRLTYPMTNSDTGYIPRITNRENHSLSVGLYIDPGMFCKRKSKK